MINIEYKTLFSRGYSDVNPVLFGSEHCEKAHHYGPAVREYWLLHFVVSGKGKFKTSRGEYELSKNDMFIIKPYEITYYEADFDDPWEYIWIGFTANVRIPTNLDKNDTIYAPYLAKVFFEAREAAEKNSRSVGYEDYLCSKIWEVFSLLRHDNPSAVYTVENYIKEAINIMEAEYHRGITITEIADMLHLNRSYLSTVFKNAMKQSAKEYLTNLRMKRSAKMLKSGQYTVSVVAASVGFSDVSCFSRSFKTFFGVSPIDYINT